MYLAFGDKLTHAQGPQAPLHIYKWAQNLWTSWILASLIIEPKSLVGPTNGPGHIQQHTNLTYRLGGEEVLMVSSLFIWSLIFC